MSSTTLKVYAPRQLVAGMRWTGSNAAYAAIRHWAGRKVYLDAWRLFLATDDANEEVTVGNYIVLVGDSFHQFTEKELQDVYIEVKAPDL